MHQVTPPTWLARAWRKRRQTGRAGLNWTVAGRAWLADLGSEQCGSAGVGVLVNVHIRAQG